MKKLWFKIPQQGLDLELIKKFKEMEFKDIYE
jgi:hypothetical protein